MRVSEIMTTQVKTVSPSDTIQKAAEIMKRIDCGSVPVMDNDRAVGMVTDRDIRGRFPSQVLYDKIGRDGQCQDGCPGSCQYHGRSSS